MAQLVTDERQPAEEHLATTTADAADDDVSPARYDVRFNFSEFQVFMAGFLAVVAVAGGIIAGLVFTNT